MTPLRASGCSRLYKAMLRKQNYCNPCRSLVNNTIYNSLDELTAQAEQIDQRRWRSLGYASVAKGTEGFSGTDTLDRTIELARYGWIEGRTRINRILEENFNITPGQREEQQAELSFDVVGDDFEVGRYTSGAPEFMWSRADLPVQVPGQEFNLFVFNEADMHMTAEQLILNGTTVAAAAIIMARKGMQVGITMGFTHQALEYPGDKLDIYVPLKKPHEELDIGRLAFAMAHPSMERRLIAVSMEHESTQIQKAFWVGPYMHESGGYGATYNHRGGDKFGRVPLHSHMPNAAWPGLGPGLRITGMR